MRLFRVLFYFIPVNKLYQWSINVARRYEKKSTTKVHYFGSAYKSKDIFDRKMYTEIQMMEFENKLFVAPASCDKMLSSIYGKYMQLPDEDKRVTRHDLTELDLT